ncbi:MAG TPA: helix-turn-helix transcriptional regulator [Pyrinomonadaceae bacterium]|nr:helix-turn-helix transcriptional regulator [Pyrinomonadaceae bacterium]
MKPSISDQTSEGRTAATSSTAASSLGEQLRRAREARGVRLREISEQTRISIRYLEAIEADDYKQLPGGIFNRSFVKAYARHVGLNEKEALDAYNRIAREHGESPDEGPPIAQRSRVYMDGQTNRSPLVTGLLTILVLAILSLAVYAALRGYQKRTQNPVAATAPANPPPTAALPAPTAAPVADFNVQISAVGEQVWMRVRADGENSTEMTLNPNNLKEYQPRDAITIWYSPARAKSVAVKINGRPARVPTEPKPKSQLVEMAITRADYQNLLQ